MDQQRNALRFHAPLLATLLALLLGLGARAQSAPGTFDVNTFRPNVDLGDLSVVERASIYKDYDVHAGLWINYADDPLVTSVRKGSGTSDEKALIDSRVGADAVGSISLFKFLLVGVDVPLILAQNGGVYHASGKEEGGSVGIGDIALRGRGVYRFTSGSADWGLGLGMLLTFPSGNVKSYQGSPTVSGGPNLIADVDLGPALLALNVGFLFREGTSQPGISLGQEIRYGLGGLWRIIQGDDLFYATAELSGATQLADFFSRSGSPLELLAGLGYHFEFGLVVSAGAGPGLLPGYGAPDVRVVGMVGYAPRHVASKPKPYELKPRPLTDVDHDAVLDIYDRCPNDPEDMDGFQDQDGCPDPDNDQDGIPDAKDRCPDQPETQNGVDDADGCPDADRDGDGIADDKDKCPTVPEDKDGFEDDDGCPDGDNDGDIIMDEADQCPMLAETMNGINDEDGCPDWVRQENDRLVFLAPIRFSGRNQAVAKPSIKVLDEAVALIKAHPEWGRIRVEAHTSDRGKAEKNLKLSEMRARQVLMFLVRGGVDPERLSAQGFGGTKPIADNAASEGRNKNERVELAILGKE